MDFSVWIFIVKLLLLPLYCDGDGDDDDYDDSRWVDGLGKILCIFVYIIRWSTIEWVEYIVIEKEVRNWK